MATHSSILAQRIPRTEETGGYCPCGCRVGHNQVTNTHRGQKILTYKDTPIKLSADFSAETLQSKRRWSDIFKILKDKNYHPMWRKGKLCFAHCWWGCKLVQLLRKTVQRFIKKLKTELFYDPIIPLLGTYSPLPSKKTKNNSKKSMNSNVHSSNIYNCQDMEAT